MLENGRNDAEASLRILAKIDKPGGGRQQLSWLDIEALSSEPAKGAKVQPDFLNLQLVAEKSPKEKDDVLDPSNYRLERSAEVVERLQHRFDGKLFPRDRDDDLAKRCEGLQKDMKAWCKRVNDCGLNKEQCKNGADIYVRLAALMLDQKIMKHAGGVGPADYNYQRALELARASGDKDTLLAVSRVYSSFLKANFPRDTGKQATAKALDEYIEKNSK